MALQDRVWVCQIRLSGDLGTVPNFIFCKFHQLPHLNYTGEGGSRRIWRRVDRMLGESTGPHVLFGQLRPVSPLVKVTEMGGPQT